MLPYILFLIIIIFAAFWELINPKANNFLIVRFVFFSFLLLAGLTDGNGLDWFGTETEDGYGLIDYRSLGFEGLKKFEPGFVLINIILGNFHLFIFLMCFVCFLLVWRTIEWGCNYKNLALFVFLATMTLYCYMGVYRHAIAQTILISSWPFIENRRKMAFLILLASTFHISSIIGLLLLLIPRSFIINFKYYIVIALITYVLRDYILPILQIISIFLPGETFGKINHYISADDFGSGISLLLLSSKLILLLFANWYFDKRDVKQCFLYNTYAISILLFFLFSFSPSFARVSLLFSCTEILLVPVTFEKILQKAKSKFSYSRIILLPYFFFIIVLYSYTYFKYLIPYSNIYIPYNSILF